MNAPRLLLAAAAAFTLCSCSATEQLGLDDYVPKKKVVYEQPVENTADRTEPFAQRLRYPVPDRSWEQESASEYEPWTQVGQAAKAR